MKAGLTSVTSLPLTHTTRRQTWQEESWKVELVCLQKDDAFVSGHVFWIISRSKEGRKERAEVETLQATPSPRKSI